METPLVEIMNPLFYQLVDITSTWPQSSPHEDVDRCAYRDRTRAMDDGGAVRREPDGALVTPKI
jgi:hypothetical protein